MKYGVITYSAWKDRIEAEINLGDTIQEFSILNIFKRMGIAGKDIVRIDHNEIHDYKGEYVLIPICTNTSVHNNTFPMSDRIIPCFIGLSLFSSGGLSNELVRYFKKFEPIGCRDESTFALMKEHGIVAYLAGCTTATLPRRDDKVPNCKMKKAFIIDVADSLIKKFPAELYREYDVEVLSHIVKGEEFRDIDTAEKITMERMERYRREAALVIISRLHGLSPCMAMGIPVIGLFTNLSPRMGWIDKFLHLYTEDDMDNIDWHGEIVDYEPMKEKMLAVAENNIKNIYSRYKDICELSMLFEDREKCIYGNYYKKMIKNLPRESNFKYIIWGSAQLGLHVVEAMKEWYPEAKLVGVIDSYQNGDFWGLPIQRPSSIEKEYMDVFCISCTYSGRSYVKEYMKKIGKTNYISFASVNG